jgi:hypothetical protein
MSPHTNFRVVNPEPKDPLQNLVDTRRGVVVSRSQTLARATALDAATTIAAPMASALVVIDSPTLQTVIAAQLAATAPSLRWRFFVPGELTTTPCISPAEVVLANHAVAQPRSRAARALQDIVLRAPWAVVMMRPRDLVLCPRLLDAVGGPVVDLDHPRPAARGSGRRGAAGPTPALP